MGKGKICRRVIAPGMLPGVSTRSVARGDFMAIYERVISLKSSNRGFFDRIYVSTHNNNFTIILLVGPWGFVRDFICAKRYFILLDLTMNLKRVG